MPLPRSLASLLARQDGVVSRAQALRCGVSQATVSRWVAERAWTRLFPGVFLAEGHRYCPEVTLRAAVLWAGDAAVAAGPAAAAWYGLKIRPGPPYDIVVPRSVKRRPQPGVRLIRRDLARADRTTRRSLPLVVKPLAVLQTAVSVPKGSTFLDRALQRGVTLDELLRCHHRHLGATGSPEAGRLLTAAADGAESQAERMLVAALRSADVSGWVLGHPAGPYRIDLAFPEAKVAVEVDGWAWHVDAERFRADRRKGNALANTGWHLLRFTWHDLDEDPADCVRQIRAALSR